MTPTTLPCKEVEFRRARLASLLLWLGAVLVVLGVPVSLAFFGWHAGLFGFATAIGSWLMAARVHRRRRLGGTITLAQGRLRVVEGGGGTHDVPFTEIESGYVAPTEGAAVLLLRSGAQLLVRLEGDGPSKVLAHAGVGPAQRVLTLPLRRTLGAFTIGFMTFWPLLFGWFIAAATVLAHERALVLPVALLLAAASTALVVARFGFPRATVGTDGIRVRGVLRQRFIPHEAIAGVEIVPSVYANTAPSIRVLLDGQAALSLPTVAAPTERIEGLALRIREAALAHASGGARRLDALAQRGRSIDAWKDDVARMALAPPGFRDQSLGRDDFEQVLEDAAAPPDQRIGAALALRAIDPSGAPARIRVAAEASADDALRDALASAAEGEIDDAVLLRANARKAAR